MARGGETHLWSRPRESTFFPASTVLRNRRLVTFDSDDEDADAGALLPTKLNDCPVMAPSSGKPSQIAYVTEGRVESVQFDIAREDLRVALRGIPSDAWTSLLDEDDRQKLMRYLPKLDGLNGISRDEAQRLNVEALLGGDNFHFGNAVATLERSLSSGTLTVQAIATREAQRQVDFGRFDLNRQAIARTRLEELKRQHGEKNDDDSLQAWKKIRLSSQKGSVHCEGNASNLVTEESSLFVSIRHVLTKEKLTAQQVADKLQNGKHALASAFGGPPLFIAFNRYIEAALAFLGDAKIPFDHDQHWSSAHFLKQDADGFYAWHNEGHVKETQDEETRALLLLEQVFRAPVSSEFVDTTTNSSAVKATRKRRDQVLLKRAVEAVQVHYSSDRSQEARSASSLLKQAMTVRTDQQTIDKSSFQEQERKRYSQAHQAFVYADAHSGQRWAVGPSFEGQPAQIDRLTEKVLRPEVPDTVNLLSLVYDACACLNGGAGSRADIRSNLLRSQFIKPDATKGAIDEAIAAALDVLEAQPPREASTPCVRLDSQSLCWRYVHAANEWSAVAADPEAEPSSKPVTPSKMSMKDLLH